MGENIINGFKITTEFTTRDAGNCKWAFAEKEKLGKKFFIKQFLSPKYPEPKAEIAEATRKKMIKECKEWFAKHEAVYKKVLNCRASNVVSPIDFFQHMNNYYLVTEKIEACSVKFSEICNKSNVQKEVIMKVLAHEMACLGGADVVHSDLKPENILLKATTGDFFTAKIIDFDGSFLASDPPDPDDLCGDTVYFSPEMLLYICEEDAKVTPKSDVFALGIIFHLIISGKLPTYSEEFDCIGHAVLNDSKIGLDSSIPVSYRRLIEKMLCKDADARPSAQTVFKELLGMKL